MILSWHWDPPNKVLGSRVTGGNVLEKLLSFLLLVIGEDPVIG